MVWKRTSCFNIMILETQVSICAGPDSAWWNPKRLQDSLLISTRVADRNPRITWLWLLVKNVYGVFCWSTGPKLRPYTAVLTFSLSLDLPYLTVRPMLDAVHKCAVCVKGILLERMKHGRRVYPVADPSQLFTARAPERHVTQYCLG